MTLGDVNVTLAADSKKNRAKAVQEGPAAEPKKTFIFKAPAVPKLADITEGIEGRRRALEEFNSFKAEVNLQMPAMVGQLRLIESMEEEERSLYVEMYNEVQNAVATMLSYGESAARNVSVLAYAKANVATCPTYRGAIEKTMEQLAATGFISLVTGTTGTARNASQVRVYSNIYGLTDAFVRSAEAQNVLNEINGLVRRTVEAGRARFQQDLADIRQKAEELGQITIADLAQGVAGYLLLEVPDTQADGKIFKGGWLLVKSSDRRITPVAAAGYIQRMAEEMVVGKIFIYADQVGQSILNTGKRLDREVFYSTLQLWRWVNSAVELAAQKAAQTAAQAEWEVKVTAERDALRPQATLSPEEFFLEGKTGIVFYDFGQGRPFEWRTKSVEGQQTSIDLYDLFALVERAPNGQIRVSGFPERLREFFAEHGEFMEPGDRFYGLGVLGVLMRFGYAEARRNATAESAQPAEEAQKTVDPVTAELAEVFGVEPQELGKEEDPKPSPKKRSARGRGAGAGK